MCANFHCEEKDTINGVVQSVLASPLRSKKSSRGYNNTVLVLTLDLAGHHLSFSLLGSMKGAWELFGLKTTLSPSKV